MNQSELKAKTHRWCLARENLKRRKSTGRDKIVTGPSAEKHVTVAKRGKTHVTLMNITTALFCATL